MIATDRNTSLAFLSSHFLRREQHMQNTVQSLVLPQLKYLRMSAERLLPTQMLSTLGNSNSAYNSIGRRSREAFNTTKSRAVTFLEQSAARSTLLKD